MATTHRWLTVVTLAVIATGWTAPCGANQADDDPYRWLEDVGADRSRAWVDERNAECTSTLARGERFQELERRILGILNSKDKIPAVRKIGDQFYNFWRDATHPKGVWRRTSLEEFCKPEPAWETVLDVDALATAESEDWVWHDATVLEPAADRCLIEISRGGSDAHVVREFDLVRREFVPGGFSLPEAKTTVSWRTRDCILVATDFGPGSTTTSGYPRTVREWRRGTPLASAEMVYEGSIEDMSVAGRHDATPGFERDVIGRETGFFTSEVFLRRDGLIRIQKPADATATLHREWLLLALRSPWAAGGREFPAGTLLAVDLDRHLAGTGEFHVIFTPTETSSLVSVAGTRHRLLLSILDNVSSRVFSLSFHGDEWHRDPLPGVPDFGTATALPLDPLEDDRYLLTTASSLQPATLSLGSADALAAPRQLKQTPAFFNATDLSVGQHFAISRDGTRIPYFQVGPKHLPLDGSTPTLLYGYGGFEIPVLPDYIPIAGASWLERERVYVIANIRGGGEFGPAWHQAATKSGRHRAYEDFIAVAEDLIARKVTSAPRLGIRGGSNGGLLVGNMYAMRPDLFGAVVCQMPLLDMRRYHLLLAGSSWVEEYGNPDSPEDWAFLRTFSPYHLVSRDRSYPPILITTSTRDDRVHPGHARKMTARLREFGKIVHSYENTTGGHLGAADNRQKAFMDALGYTFLEEALTRAPGDTR
jgi:prolyl oligopeptidase